MATGKSKGNGKVELLCDDCGVEIFFDENMIMLKDDVWKRINHGRMDGAACDTCITRRLGRPVFISDFKESDNMYGTPLCNVFWVEVQKLRGIKIT